MVQNEAVSLLEGHEQELQRHWGWKGPLKIICAQALCSMLVQLEQIAQGNYPGHIQWVFFPFSVFFYFFSEEFFLNKKVLTIDCGMSTLALLNPLQVLSRNKHLRNQDLSLCKCYPLVMPTRSWKLEEPAGIDLPAHKSCPLSSTQPIPLPWGLPVLVCPRSKAHRHCDLGHQQAAYAVRCAHSERTGVSGHYSHLLLGCNVH